jgi:hypothetical protein
VLDNYVKNKWYDMVLLELLRSTYSLFPNANKKERNENKKEKKKIKE